MEITEETKRPPSVDLPTKEECWLAFAEIIGHAYAELWIKEGAARSASKQERYQGYGAPLDTLATAE